MIIICGKSCSGKNTVVSAIAERGYKAVVPYTTRSMRTGETDGKEYHFVSEEEFNHLYVNKKFVVTSAFESTQGHLSYGIFASDLTADSVAIMDMIQLEKYMRVMRRDTVVFYLNTRDAVITKRSRARGDNASEAARCLVADTGDFSNVNRFVDVSIRNDGDLTPEQLADIILHMHDTILASRNECRHE